MYRKDVSGVVWRGAAVLIVVFWLVMTGQLARLLLFPEGSFLAQVPPAFVVDLFFRRGEPSQLLVLRDGRQVGELNVGTKRLGGQTGGPGTGEGESRPGDGGEGDKEDKGERITQINVAGFLEIDHPMIEAGNVSGRVRVDLSGDLELRGVGVFFREQGARRAVEIDYVPEPMDVRYRVLEAGRVVEEIRPLQDEATALQAKLMLALWGVDASALDGAGGVSGGGGGFGALSAESMRAYHGQVSVRGHRFHAYILELDLAGNGPVKLVFSEAGELMHVESLLDYELLSEVFVADEIEEGLEID